MKNKVLVRFVVPELNSSFDAFLPVNEIMWKVKKMVAKSIYDISGGAFSTDKEYTLINMENNRVYKNNEVIIDTDIRNASQILIISNKNI